MAKYFVDYMVNGKSDAQVIEADSDEKAEGIIKEEIPNAIVFGAILWEDN